MSRRRRPAPGQNSAVTAREPSSRELHCCPPNSAYHPIVDAAPTEMIRECVLDLFVVRVAIAIQKDILGHDDSVRAIVAMCVLLGDDCILQSLMIFHRTIALQR